jgi:uncharacterized protein (DUF58 family)
LNLVYKVIYRFYRLYSSIRYRAERRWTGLGLALAGAMIVAAMMGPDTDNNVSYQAFAVLFCVLLISALLSLSFRARFTARRRLPRFGTVGAPFTYGVEIRSLASGIQRGLTLLEDLEDSRPSFQDWLAAQRASEQGLRAFRIGQTPFANPFKRAAVKEAAVPPAPPRQPVAVRVELTPLRRGLLRFRGVTIARPDPLGVCRAFRNVALPQTVLILPKRYLLPPIALPGLMKYQEGGVAMASNVGQSEEFVALRDYRHGDPMRHIHWRSWARAGKPVVKEFEDEFFVRHALVLDTFTAHPHSEMFEEAVSVAASFACAIQTQESLLDLLFVGPESYCFTAGRGLAHADQMLEILASVQACRIQPFQTLEHLVLDHIGVVSGCICVLLAWDEPRREFVRKLRAAGMPLLVLVIVPEGMGKELDLGPMRDQPEKFRVLEAGKVEQELAALR